MQYGRFCEPKEAVLEDNIGAFADQKRLYRGTRKTAHDEDFTHRCCPPARVQVRFRTAKSLCRKNIAFEQGAGVAADGENRDEMVDFG